jgi:N6-adenosine-specific RNA methylase IME4
MCIGNRARSVVAMTEIEQASGARKPLDEILPEKFGPLVHEGIGGRVGASANYWAARITARWRDTVDGIIDTALLIVAAKEALPHGEFGKMIEAGLPFSASTARRLMAIAMDPRISNRAHVHVLPPHWGTLYEITKLDDAQFEARVADGSIRPDMERRDIATAVKQARRAARERELGQRQLEAPDGKFGIIVEDFEWDYEVYSRETGMDRHAANHYETADDAHTPEEIVARTAERFACADDNCVLWMYAPAPHLAIAIKVLELRGFKYVSNYVWRKPTIITGWWARFKHEHLLIGIKGDVPCPAPGTQWDSVIDAARGEHSAKPDDILEMIDEYFPTWRKIELNRRGLPRPGWAAWGNEATDKARPCGAAFSNQATPLLLAPPTTQVAATGGYDPRLEGDGLDIPAFLRRTSEVVAVS